MYTQEYTQEQVIYNVNQRGGGIRGSYDPTEKLVPLEELIPYIFLFKEPRITAEIPKLLKKNKIDYEKLLQNAGQKGVLGELGYVLDNASALFGRHDQPYEQQGELQNALGTIQKILSEQGHFKQKPRIMIDSSAPKLEEVLTEMQLPSEKKWNVLGRISPESFDHSYMNGRA
jgi:hypothetical protein